MKPIKILITAPNLITGGAEKQLIYLMDGLLNKRGFNFVLLLFEPEGSLDQVEKLPFSMTLAASSYEAIKKFVADLEKNIRPIEVRELSFSIPETGGVFDVSIHAETYYQ